MEKSRVEIRVAPAPWSESGADAVEILISPNLGEEPKPLDKIASGGEISRIALALKTCTASADSGASSTRRVDRCVARSPSAIRSGSSAARPSSR